jgi:anti-sigma B factor antagonist
VTIEAVRFGAVVVVTVSGELDITTTPALREALDQAIAEKPDTLVLDLTGISFMDSIALAAVLQASRKIGDARRLPIIVDAGSYARLILDATGLSDRLDVVAAREAA